MKLNSLVKDKKGMGIGDLYPIILIIATIAILLAIVLMVMEEWQGATNTQDGTTTDEQDHWINRTAFAVTNKSTSCGFTNLAVTGAWNQSDGTAIASGNYTVDADAGTIVGTTACGNYSSVNISYTFNYGGADCEAMEDIVEDFTDFIPWIGIILLVIAAAIVLGIVITSFRKPRV